MPLLEIFTERLILRSISLNDSDSILKYRADIHVNKYQGWIPKNIEDVYDFIENRVVSEINRVNTWHQLVIIHQESNKIIGDIGIHFMDNENKQVEIGFTLDKDYQGMGFASESVKEVLAYLFKKLNKHRVIASVDPRNIKSINLLERIGFRKEAHFIKSIFMDGEWVDDIIYAMLNEEWI